MAKKTEYKIGTWVWSNQKVIFEYQGREGIQDPDFGDCHSFRYYERTAVPIQCHVSGQIVGGRFRPLGRYQHATGNTWAGEDPEGATLNVSNYQFVYLVKEGFTNKPVEVLPEDIRVHAKPGRSLPFRKCIQPKATPSRIAQLTNKPRKNGRYVKQDGTL